MTATLTQQGDTVHVGDTIGGAYAEGTPEEFRVNGESLDNQSIAGGVWSGDIPDSVGVLGEGVEVRAYVDGNSVALAGTLTVALDAGDADWYYADQQAVSDAISAAGLAIMSNMENTANDPVVARIQRAGNRADALMNGRLRGMGYAISDGGMDISDGGDAAILAEISVGIVIALLCRWRVLQVANFAGQATTTVDKVGAGFLKSADDMLWQIQTGYLSLAATRSVAGPQSNERGLGVNGSPLYPAAWPGYLALN